MYIVQMKEFSKLPLPKALQDHFAFKAGTIFKVAQKNNSFIFTPLKKPAAPLLEINCFGYFSVKTAGQECTYLQKQRKTAELLAYLFINHDCFITKSSIADALWPSLEPTRAMDNFYKTYKKLNTLIPKPLPLQLDSFRTRIRLRTPSVQSDLFHFHQLCQSKNNIQAYEQAIALYQGPLFYKEYYSWSTISEAYYEIQYQNLLESVIKYYEMHPKSKKAAYYRQKMTEEV